MSLELLLPHADGTLKPYRPGLPATLRAARRAAAQSYSLLCGSRGL